MDLLKVLLGQRPGLLQWLSGVKDEKALIEIMDSGNYDIEGYSRVLTSTRLPNEEHSDCIDIIFIHEKGIFIGECMKTKGTIIGDKYSGCWSDYSPSGERTCFPNPITENELHCKALSAILGIDREKIFSYIVFDDKCCIQNVPDDSDTYRIVSRNNVFKIFRADLKKRDAVMTESEIDETYHRLKGREKRSTEDNVSYITDTRADGFMVCPVCGGRLVLKNSPFGPFYGCSNYPECHYTQKCGQNKK